METFNNNARDLSLEPQPDIALATSILIASN